MEAAQAEYERKSQEESAASQRQRAEEFRKMVADPGLLSVQESDAQIERLRSPSSLIRANAAEKLGDAKGRRGVDALVADLRSESDPMVFSAVAMALAEIQDPRAAEALAESLSEQNLPDRAREHALDAIVAFQSEWRFVPQIQRFYDSLTDESVRGRVRLVVERFGGATRTP